MVEVAVKLFPGEPFRDGRTDGPGEVEHTRIVSDGIADRSDSIADGGPDISGHRPSSSVTGRGCQGSSLHSRVIRAAGGRASVRGRRAGRHLMGFEKDRSANLGPVVYATKRRSGLT
jgi:hypothetical protein